MITSADQAGVEQHRIDRTEFAAGHAFRQQAAMKIEQRADKELRHFVGCLIAVFMQQIVDQPVHIGELVIGPDDASDVQPHLLSSGHRLRHQDFEIDHLGGGVALQQRQQQAILVAEVILHQGGVDASLMRDVAQRDIDRIALNHQLPGRDQQLVGGRVLASGVPMRGDGIQVQHPDSRQVQPDLQILRG